MVDGVELVEAEHIIAYKLVSHNEPQFQGHFPDAPVMPGVLLLEGIVQSAALLAHHRGEFDATSERLFLMTIDKVKFRQPVSPGQRLDYHVWALRGGKLWRGRGEIKVGGTEVASAEFTAAIRPLGEH
ncbi:MAG: 3-hydroxyacyl-[acyl-carrier-protein] dehydratase FabZ [Deltaproteobacteria bacterium]|nr:3-hydroxyacyl-[acyl-carrier-protein] dehydratase FabZ [Deltaproteobacteria bacterium]